MSAIKKLALSLLVIFIIAPVAVRVAWDSYTIYDEVRSGSAYGFTIGASKRDTYLALQTQNFHSVWLSYKENATPKLEVLQFKEVGFEKFSKVDNWDLTYGSRSLLNCIRLEFKDGKLVYIYRHRQAIELP